MSSNVTIVFTPEEEQSIIGITQEFRKIYENATYLSLQMEKIEEEMKTIMERSNNLRQEETSIYIRVVERTGLTLEEVQKASGQYALSEVLKNNNG